MGKTKEVLRLCYDLKLSAHRVAGSCSIAASTVRECVRRAEAAGITWPLPAGLDDDALEVRLFPERHSSSGASLPLPSMERIHQVLRVKGVTRQLVWLEYKEQHPGGYEYSQFCEL